MRFWAAHTGGVGRGGLGVHHHADERSQHSSPTRCGGKGRTLQPQRTRSAGATGPARSSPSGARTGPIPISRSMHRLPIDAESPQHERRRPGRRPTPANSETPAKAGVRRGPTRADADEITLTPQGSLVGSQYRPPSIPVIAGLRALDVYLLPALSLYLRFRRSQRVREPGAPAALLVSQNLKDVGCRAAGRARSCLGCFGRMSDAQHHLGVIGPSHEPLQPAAEGDQIHGLAQRATGQA